MLDDVHRLSLEREIKVNLTQQRSRTMAYNGANVTTRRKSVSRRNRKAVVEAPSALRFRPFFTTTYNVLQR